jgi:hypothetical protein
MRAILSAITTWVKTHEYLAIWLEGIALVAIFIWDRIDSREQHKETLKQMGVMERHVLETGKVADAAKANAEAAELNANRTAAVLRDMKSRSIAPSTVRFDHDLDILIEGHQKT